jgi:hypothetical protein
LSLISITPVEPKLEEIFINYLDNSHGSKMPQEAQ